MNCPRCTGETRVLATRKPSTNERAASRKEIDAAKTANWYTLDWTVRTRMCKECAAVTCTVEVYADDMTGMLLSAERGERQC